MQAYLWFAKRVFRSASKFFLKKSRISDLARSASKSEATPRPSLVASAPHYTKFLQEKTQRRVREG